MINILVYILRRLGISQSTAVQEALKLAIELAVSFVGLDKSMIADVNVRQPQIGIAYGLEQLNARL